MKKYYPLLLVLIILFSGCGMIAINENDYRFLPQEYKHYIKPFRPELVTQKINYKKDSLFLYEINTPEIKKVLRQYKYVWLHLWRPYCEADYCQNISFFAQLAWRYQNKGLQLLFISEDYDPITIQKVLAHSIFDKPIFVLQDIWYGHKIKKNSRLLFNEINNNPAIHSKRGFDDYLFKDTLLVYAGNRMSERVLDSLLQPSQSAVKIPYLKNKH